MMIFLINGQVHIHSHQRHLESEETKIDLKQFYLDSINKVKAFLKVRKHRRAKL